MLTRLDKKLQQQYADAINQRHGKNAFGRAVAVRVDIEREERDVAYQAPDPKEGDQLLLPEEQVQEIIEFVTGELDEINNDQDDDRGNEA
jgi:hypothetical protein